jgi:hypothetical protein
MLRRNGSSVFSQHESSRGYRNQPRLICLKCVDLFIPAAIPTALRGELIVRKKCTSVAWAFLIKLDTRRKGMDRYIWIVPKTQPPERRLRNARAAAGPMQRRPEGTEAQ